MRLPCDNIDLTDILNIQIHTIPNKIHLYAFYIDNAQERQFWLFDIISIKKVDNTNTSIEIDGTIEPDKWNIKYFYPVFDKNFKQISNKSVRAWCINENELNFYFHILIPINKELHSKTVQEVLQIYRDKISSVYQKSMQEIEMNMMQNIISSETISLKFLFPRHLKALCKQYLSYFDKFLLDNGINCELSLIDQDDITYMTINVDDFSLNVDDLKEALAGYFSLPVLSRENITFENQNIAVQQLIANIEHLKSQLRLANLTISQYENLSSSRLEYVIIDSLKEKSAIELYDGFIKINKIIKLKFFGLDIEFDIPKLLEKIKQRE